MPTDSFVNQHPSLLVAVYRSCFDLLRSDCFTADAAHQAVKRYFSGYNLGEVTAMLDALVQTADLVQVVCSDRPLYMRGPRFPAVNLWPDALS